MECIGASVVVDHPTRYGGIPSTVLDPRACGLLLIGLASYLVMRVWSGLFFIREMLAFQKIPPDSAPSPELSARVARWTYWTWFREPLDAISLQCFLVALYWLGL